MNANQFANWNFTTALQFDFVVFPFNFAGVQLGIIAITLFASLSHSGQPGTPFKTVIFVMLPLLSTIKFK